MTSNQAGGLILDTSQIALSNDLSGYTTATTLSTLLAAKQPTITATCGFLTGSPSAAFTIIGNALTILEVSSSTTLRGLQMTVLILINH